MSFLSKHVKKLPESKAINKEQILYLIDLALLTGDEEWFIKLSSKLNSINELVNGEFKNYIKYNFFGIFSCDKINCFV